MGINIENISIEEADFSFLVGYPTSSFESVGQEFILRFKGETYVFHAVSVFVPSLPEKWRWIVTLTDLVEFNESTKRRAVYEELLGSCETSPDPHYRIPCRREKIIEKQFMETLSEHMTNKSIDTLSQVFLKEIIKPMILNAHLEMIKRLENEYRRDSAFYALHRATSERERVLEELSADL